ncbi:MAG: proline--tRNA ligase [Pseudomonadota bacterium]|nr:proline--tRNA ligase [Pseudomonadota bacterium]
MSAISPTRKEDFPLWYQAVVQPLAQNGAVRGTQVIKPLGYGIWENLQNELNTRIQDKGVENFYAPLFVGADAIQAEVNHIEGFAKECAVVTHSRLKVVDGKLALDGELTEPVIIRPTSEAIIGPIVKDWIASYRDLPLKLNQWANIVRWEMRTRLFLRSTEFLWQEGHTFHANEQEANAFAREMLECYQSFLKDMLALPALTGEKSELERFSGANHTYTLELMMQDGKALQGGTSHDLGQNFAKAYDIGYANEDGGISHVHGTSWGVTTRMIGAMAMVHGDDDGLCIPPRVSPIQIVILPINPKEDPEVETKILAVEQQLKALTYQGKGVRVRIDRRQMRGGAKAWDWVKKGIPLRIEIGPKDIEKQQICVSRRDLPYGEKQFMPLANLHEIVEMLESIHQSMYTRAERFMTEHITPLDSVEAMIQHFNEGKRGFVKVFYAGGAEEEATLASHKISIRCIVEEGEGNCVFTGHATQKVAYIAMAY